MSDLDFDELDKAVGDMMSDPSKDAPEGDKKSAEDEGEQENAPIEAGELHEEIAVSKPARRGRFMDIVHPSSDMLNGKKSPVTNQKFATAAEIVPPTEEIEDVEVGAVGSAFDAESAVQELNDADDGGDSPNFFEGGEAEEAKETEETEVEQPITDDGGDEEIVKETEEYEEAEEPEDESTPELMATPFLPDAKVDKRPLGGGAAAKSGSTHADIKSTEGDFSTKSIVDASDEHRAIFDSEEISDTVVVPSKKKSSLVILLIVLGAALVGVGAGIAAFSFLFK